MSKIHPKPWNAEYETSVMVNRKRVDIWAVLDARGAFLVEGIDEETAREIADGETKEKRNE